MLASLSGTVVKSYQVGELLGEGGFGSVFRATQPSIGRDVAIKIILPAFANQPDFIRHFEAEAQIIARLEHPYIIPLYDYWRDPSGAYLVMRYLRGASLRHSLEEYGAWGIVQVVQMLRQIASALSFAHANGVIHGDVKTDNILLDELGNSYLGDFGIAKVLGDGEQSGGIHGTLTSLAPEQIQGNPASIQSDVYALGILVFETLTGQKPFFGESSSKILMRQLNDPLPPLSQFRKDLSEELNLVLQRTTSKDPSARYDSVMAFAQAFIRLVHEDELIAELSSPLLDTLTQPEEVIFQATNPYKGLRAFQYADAEDFFGRESLVEELLHCLSIHGKNQNFLALIGASGSGKSSLVKAGLLPRIREGILGQETIWYTSEMVPGSHPIEDLRMAILGIAMSPMPNLLEQLRQDEHGLLRILEQILPENSKLILLIDQFEEVFTLIADEDERLHFLNSILYAVENAPSRIKIIITLRADFYDRPLFYTQFGDLIRQHSQLVLPLSDKELEASIKAPVERLGFSFEASLVDAILADVVRQPGALPLLQYALTELFERRERNKLTLKAYRDIGGITGAVARRADELYENFGAEEQAAARQMFLRLINLGEGADDTRRRVHQADLLSIRSHSAMQTVIEQFGKYRLLTFDHEAQSRASTVELAHEALIRQWQRVREWLDTNREGLRLHRRLSSSAEEWLQASRDPSFLAQGIRLQHFEAFQTGEIALSQPEREFLAESIQAHSAHLKAEASREAREKALERQSAQRLRLLTTVTSIAAIISIVLAYFATQAQSTAVEQAAIAATEAALASENEAKAVTLQQEAQSRLLVSQLPGIYASDPALAYSLGLEILTLMDNPPVAVSYAINDMFLTNFVIQEFFGHHEGVSDVAFAPDGRTALTSTQEGRILLWDTQTGTIIGDFIGHDAWVPSIQFSPDGSRALSASRDGRAIVWDVASRNPILSFDEHGIDVRVARFTPDGEHVLSGDENGLLLYWDTVTGKEIRRMEGHSNQIWDIAISANGVYALSGSKDKTAILWDLTTGESLRVFTNNNEIVSLAFLPDSQHFLLASSGITMDLWSIESEAPILIYSGLGGSAWAMAINPDGKYVVLALDNGMLEVWDIMLGRRLHILHGHRGFGTGVAISRDGHTMLSVAEDQTMFYWDLGAISAEASWFSHHGAVASSAALSGDSSHLVTGSRKDSIRIWNLASQEVLLTLDVQDMVTTSVAYAPDNRTVLNGTDVGLISLWDASTGERLLSIDAHDESIKGLAYLPDSQQAFSVSADSTMLRWDLTTGQRLASYEAHADAILGLDISPDGQSVLTASADNTLILWDVATGETIRSLLGHRRAVNAVVFSPDGTMALSASDDSRLILWNIETGETIREFVGHSGSVTSVDFSPDGLTAISGTNGGAIYLWDVARGERLRRFEAFNWVVAVAYLPNGKQILSLAGDGRVAISQAHIPNPELIDWVQSNRYLATLSCEDRLRYYLISECEEIQP